MCIIIMDALSLKVTAPNLLELSVSLMLIQENEKENHSLLLTELLFNNKLVVLTIINPVKPKIIQTPDIYFTSGAGHYS